MYKEPCEDVLNPQLSKVLCKEQIENDVAALTEVINYATFAVKRCMASHCGKLDVDLPPHFLYLHIIELADGIRVLTAEASYLPGVPLVRSMFEALLSLDFMFDDDYETRSLAWLVAWIAGRIERHELFDPNTDKHKELMKRVKGNRRELIRADKSIRRISPEVLGDKSKVTSHYRSWLKSPHVARIAEEYAKQKPDYWWRMIECDPKIRSISDLADRMGRGAQYRTLYREWSSFCHGKDIGKHTAKATKWGTAFERIRCSTDREQPSSFAVNYVVQATELMLRHFRYEELKSYWKWYRECVRKTYLSMGKLGASPTL